MIKPPPPYIQHQIPTLPSIEFLLHYDMIILAIHTEKRMRKYGIMHIRR